MDAINPNEYQDTSSNDKNTRGYQGNTDKLGKQGNKVKKDIRDNLAVSLDTYDVFVNEKTVLRLSRKLFGGEEVIDLRLWMIAKEGYLFPRKNGLCMRVEPWKLALKLFEDNRLKLFPSEIV